MPRPRTSRTCLAVLAALGGLALTPSAGQAHGPVAPVATDYLASVTRSPPGLGVKVVDGYVRLWIRVPAAQKVVVLDYRRAPYLRFTAAGVEVNRNSEMFYLNHAPLPESAPPGLAITRPRWERVSDGHAYEWHDGRLQAFAGVAAAPGRRDLGPWSVPLILDGRPAVIAGQLWHAGPPSIVWFWPIAVALLCLLAALRLRSTPVDERLARTLAVVTLAATAVAAVARELHGRPSVPVAQVIELVIALALVAWAAQRVVRHPPGWLLCVVIASAGLSLGVALLPTLVRGYVLLALPAFPTRAATLVCLAAGASLMVVGLRVASRSEAPRSASPP
jgi:hypothetical protein